MAAMEEDPLELTEDTIDIETQSLLLAAAHHDTQALKDLLKTGSANVQDADTGYTPLHAAMASFAPEGDSDTDSHSHSRPTNGSSTTKQEQDQKQKPTPGAAELQAAEDTVRVLFENGAIWNDLDSNGETAGDIAWRLGLEGLYGLVVDAGVRAEVLLNRLDDFEPLADDDDDDDDDEEDEEDGDEDGEEAAKETGISEEKANTEEQTTNQTTSSTDQTDHTQHHLQEDPSLQNETYLSSTLTLTPHRILDTSSNGVMMAWETDIMQRTASHLLPTPGLSVLNIGHGMGIIDSAFQKLRPSSHHIIEAHPDIISSMKSPDGWLAKQGSDTIVLHEGRWQDILPRLIEAGDVTFDAIYFDTFAEDYKAFRHFFEEYVVALLNQSGKWSFFHGLGADRRVCYDVYTKVAEMDLFEAGFEVEWSVLGVPIDEKEWEGVKRSYFGVEEYRLPVCRFLT